MPRSLVLPLVQHADFSFSFLEELLSQAKSAEPEQKLSARDSRVTRIWLPWCYRHQPGACHRARGW